eukprot:4971833-Alexandrium_andersonii.AAC.1
MSASLVGSEMCIRDRPPRRHGLGNTWPQHREGPRAAAHADAPLHHRQDPVSYTHLTLPTICSV